MKFKIAGNKLSKAVTIVAKGAEKQALIPTLETIKVVAKGEHVNFTSYNLIKGINIELEAEIEETGEVLLNAVLLQSLCSKLSREKEVVFSTDHQNVCNVGANNIFYTLSALDTQTFPLLPKLNNKCNKITLNYGAFKTVVSSTIYATLKETEETVNSSRNIKGLAITVENNWLTAIAIDGFRAAKKRAAIDYTGEKISVSISNQILKDVVSLSKKDDLLIQLSFDERHIVFTLENHTIISRVYGQAYEMPNGLLPRESLVLEFDVKQVKEAINKLLPVASEKQRALIMNFNFSESIVLFSLCSNLAKAETKNKFVLLKNSQSIKNLRIGCNIFYLFECITTMTSEKIKIDLGGATEAFFIMQDEDTESLILPVRLSNR